MLVSAIAETPVKRKKAKGTQDYAWPGLRGLRGFSGAVTRAGEKRLGKILDVMADEIVVQDDAECVLSMLEELASLVRVRLEAFVEVEDKG